MKKIAISCHYDSKENPYKHYGPSVIIRDYGQYPLFKEGGCPFILPSIPLDQTALEQLLEGIAGVVIYGGMDIDPAFYGEQVSASIQRYDLRDANEIALIQYCITNNIPLFGICRGMQLINVALGGTMYQDINQFVPKTTLIHDLTRDDHNKLSHSVNAKSQSFLHQATGLSQFMVNSFHHQAIKTLGKDLEVVATSDDGVIEAIQHSEGLIIGTQRHPEFNYHCNTQSQQLIQHFVQEICK